MGVLIDIENYIISHQVLVPHIDGLVQERRNSSALAILSFTSPSIYIYRFFTAMIPFHICRPDDVFQYNCRDLAKSHGTCIVKSKCTLFALLRHWIVDGCCLESSVKWGCFVTLIILPATTTTSIYEEDARWRRTVWLHCKHSSIKINREGQMFEYHC